jgi:hypothetical protein
LTLGAPRTWATVTRHVDADRADALGTSRFAARSTFVETAARFNETGLAADATIVAVARGDTPAFYTPETEPAVIGITCAAQAGDVDWGAGAVAADIGLVRAAVERVDLTVGDRTAALLAIAHLARPANVHGILPIGDEAAEPLVGANGAPATVEIAETEPLPAPALVAEEIWTAVTVLSAAEPFRRAELARRVSFQRLDATEPLAAAVVRNIAGVVELQALRIDEDHPDHALGNRERQRADEARRHD